jgi:glycosyltransferase involved in cell wall biosynthesis
LQSLAVSETQPFEIIIVDDSSTDKTAELVRDFGAMLLSTGGRKGPAHARNLGAREAAGEVIFFIDSDVCIHRNTLTRLTFGFEANPEVDAIIGSYDDSPHEQDVLSMYRNLMHRYTHQQGRREATTFWSGCGAIRRDVFLKYGGFDEGYGRPAIEDIELGSRLVASGHKILLDRDLEVKHVKHWTFLNLVKTDVFDRGMPWTELILRDGRMSNDLNLEMSQRVSVALAFMLFAFALAAAVYYKGLFLVPLLASMLFALACYWTESGVSRGKGVKLVFGLSVGAFLWLSYTHHMISLMPPVLVGYLLLFIRYRYAYKTQFVRKITGMAYGAYLIASLAFIARFLPTRVPVFCFYVMVLSIVAINHRFYIFLARRMGWLTALAAIPFHLLFYFYSGLAFLIGIAMYLKKHFLKESRDEVVRPASEPVMRSK